MTRRRIHRPLHRRSVPSGEAVVLLVAGDIVGFEEGNMGVEVVLVHVAEEQSVDYMVALAEDDSSCSLLG